MDLEQAIKEMKEHHELNHDGGEDYSDDEAVEDLLQECGQLSDGSCVMAGTEYCDWECPFNE